MYTQREQYEEVIPVAAQPVVAQPVARVPVAEVPVVPAAEMRQVTTESRQRYATDSFIVGVVGLALTIVGLLAVVRAGVEGPMDEPIVEVLGFTHTATLGMIETAMGLILLICAASTSRSASIFFGLVLGVGAFIGAVQTESFDDSLALESGWAWLVLIAAIVVVAASFLLPRFVRRSATYTSV
jgi:hypothetical protein